jgi:hypothetical protein
VPGGILRRRIIDVVKVGKDPVGDLFENRGSYGTAIIFSLGRIVDNNDNGIPGMVGRKVPDKGSFVFNCLCPLSITFVVQGNLGSTGFSGNPVMRVL